MLIDLCLEACDTAALGGADTAVLAGLAARLNVESYVLDALGSRQQRLGPEPSRWLASLRQKVFAVAVDNLRRDAELAEALARFSAAGIELIFLKGSALRILRPELAGRFQCDVDLLLRRQDLERAEKLLQDLGFRLDESYRDREGLLRDHFHLSYERRGAVVELHWDIGFSTPAGFVDRLWARSLPAALDGQPGRVLSPEHQLLVSCLHHSRHAFQQGLRWLADLRLHLPLTPEARERFEEECLAWPRRAVRCPLWTLAEQGVVAARDLGGDGGADPLERFLLRRLTGPLLVGEPWIGIPAWRLGEALEVWLFSQRPLLGLLAAASRQGVARRLRSWAAGAAEEMV